MGTVNVTRAVLLCAVALVAVGGVVLRMQSVQHEAAEKRFRDQWIAQQKDALRSGRQSTVHFYDTQSTDEMVAKLAGMPEIKGLVFELTDVSAAGLEVVAQLPQLETLTLYGGPRPAGDAELALLAGKTSLTTLKLINTDVTDDGLRVLASLPSLTELTLYRESFRPIRLTDSAVEHLRSVTALRELRIGGGWMSGAAIEELRRSLPNCKVVNDVAGRSF